MPAVHARLLLLLCVAASIVTRTSAACITTPFYLLVKDWPSCDYDGLLSAFGEFFADPINVPPGSCGGSSAEQVLWELLGVSDANGASNKVYNICLLANKNYNKAVRSIDDIVRANGNDMEANVNFMKNFYLGRTDWNEQYETKYPLDSEGNATNVLNVDAAVLNVEYYATARYGKIVFPTTLAPFSTCNLNSAYCCWTSDRQPNDGNGNCQYPTDTECVDADPADNTDLCLVSHKDGTTSTNWKSTKGQFLFPGDDEQGEGPAHCHGFVWDEFNLNDPSFVYRGNNLFYVSLYDHLYARGYVRNVPGAPMCGCTEQMPVVSRTDCTQMNVLQDFKFIYSGTAFTAEVTSVNIDFAACTGYDRTGKQMNNDLWGHYNRLFNEGRVSATKFRAFNQKVIGSDQCRLYERAHMATQLGLVVGYQEDTSEWTQVAGRDSLSIPNVSPTLFKLLFDASPNKIIRRVCANCISSHMNMYYKRVTDVPDSLDLLDALKSQNEDIADEVYGTDFLLYSTYDDAINGDNEWNCQEYKPSSYFPGGCGPDPDGMYGDQGSHFDWNSGRSDVAFYVEASTLSRSLVPKILNHVGWVNPWRDEGSMYQVGSSLYMYASGADIWDVADSFDFYDTSRTGNVTAIVKVVNLVTGQEWAKAGIDLRQTNDKNSRHFGVFTTPKHGSGSIWRTQTGGSSDGNGFGDNDFSAIWLKLVKINNRLRGYTSPDGSNWTPTGEAVTISFTGSYRIGIATSGAWDLVEATFTSYSVK